MTAVGNTSYNARIVRSLVDMRSSMNDLNTQLSTGLKAQTYGGLGDSRSLALSLSTKVARLENYTSTIDVLGVRLNTMYTTIDRMNNLTSEVSSDMDANSFDVLTDGKTVQQKTAANAMGEMIDLLNSSIAGSYVYGGRATDKAPVVDLNTIMEGVNGKAGFRQVGSERLQADQGDGLGRLALSGSTGTFTLSEDGSHPFGMKLTSVTSTFVAADVAINGPTGSPASLDVTMTDQPSAGQKMVLTLTLPDGTSKDITLTAGDATNGNTGEFEIGATPDDTLANMQAALDAQLHKAASTDLVAASAVASANNFFKTFNGGVPQRIDGPPFDTATALKDGTDADTVSWYVGENTNNATTGWSPRQDMTAQVDSAMSVQYGVRGNENAFAEAMANYAAISVVDISANDATAKATHSAVMQRAKANLSAPDDKIQSIELEIVHAQSSVTVAKQRHQTLIATYGNTLDGIQNSDDAEVAVKIQALKTRMEASYSATSILYQLSLTKYL
jgi:flagellin-like hook-associated protein FlgL